MTLLAVSRTRCDCPPCDPRRTSTESCASAIFRVSGGIAEEVEEEGLGEGVELGEGGAALGPQRLRPVQHLRNPPLLRQRRQGNCRCCHQRRHGLSSRLSPLTRIALNHAAVGVERSTRQISRVQRVRIRTKIGGSRLLKTLDRCAISARYGSSSYRSWRSVACNRTSPARTTNASMLALEWLSRPRRLSI